MGEEFVEAEVVHCKAGDYCFNLTEYAKRYVREYKGREAVKDINGGLVEAVIVDAINFIGMRCGFDFGLNVQRLYAKTDQKFPKVSAVDTITGMIHYFGSYMFDQPDGKTISHSVTYNKHLNAWSEPFDPDLGARVLVDFINYVAQTNNFDRTFSVRELYAINVKDKQKHEQKRLCAYFRTRYRAY